MNSPNVLSNFIRVDTMTFLHRVVGWFPGIIAVFQLKKPLHFNLGCIVLMCLQILLPSSELYLSKQN